MINIPPETIGDPLIGNAARLVHDRYVASERFDTRASNLFMLPKANKYFLIDVVLMHGRGSDVLYASQDYQGEVTSSHRIRTGQCFVA